MRSALLALLLFAFVAALCLSADRAGARTPPAAARQRAAAEVPLVQVLSGLNKPLYVTNAHDGSNRLFIVEQGGRIKVLQPGATAPTVFLDITPKVISGSELGLLGLAFHPQFATNRRFFVDYTRQPDNATVVAEYQVSADDPNVAETTEKVLLVIEQPSIMHKAGMIEFGPDGFFYIATGDGGPNRDPDNRAQNLHDLHGKILRVDVDHANGDQPYSSPADNPFFGTAQGRDEIWAYGLRNPWRFSFDRLTGDLYAGDVGQGAREEIDLITRGGNYGWRIFEGTNCTNLDPPLCAVVQTIPPLVEYGHPTGRCAVTGGYVYRGTRGSLPAGAYVYGDYCTGEILLLQDGVTTPLTTTARLLRSFGEDEAGEIYVVGEDGTVKRIGAEPPPPFAIARALVRKRSTGEVLDPVTVRSNGKKYEIVVFESAPAMTQASQGTKLIINGVSLKSDYLTTAAGEPIFVRQLKPAMLARPGPLTVEAVRPDGTHSNVLTLQVGAAQ